MNDAKLRRSAEDNSVNVGSLREIFPVTHCVIHPLRDSLPDIFGAGRNFDSAGLFECELSLNRRHEFHSIVRGVRVAEELLSDRAESVIRETGFECAAGSSRNLRRNQDQRS